MTRVLMDTNAYGAYARGDADAVAVIQTAAGVVMSAVNLAELLAGFATGHARRKTDGT